MNTKCVYMQYLIYITCQKKIINIERQVRKYSLRHVYCEVILKYIFTGFFKWHLTPLLWCLLAFVCQRGRIHTSHMKEKQCLWRNLLRSLHLPEFLHNVLLKCACIKDRCGRKYWAPLLINAHAVPIPAPATILRDPDIKPKLLCHHSYPFLLCFIWFISTATSPWQFLFATEALWTVPTNIKVPQWIICGPLQWSEP